MDSGNCTYDVSMQQVVAHCNAINEIRVYQAVRLQGNVHIFFIRVITYYMAWMNFLDAVA